MSAATTPAPKRLKTLPCSFTVRSLTIEGPITKLATDGNSYEIGRIEVWYEPRGRALELRGVARYLETFATIAITQEDLVAEVAQQVLNSAKAGAATVRATFAVGNLSVEAKARLVQTQ